MSVLESLPAVPTRHGAERSLQLLVLEDLQAWPEDLGLGGARFSLLLALGVGLVTEDERRSWKTFQDRVLGQGLAYFCSWGRHCELAHDLMDEALVYREAVVGEEPPFLMTTGHPKQSLEDAIFFLRACAVDPEIQDVGTAPMVIACVALPDRVAEIRSLAAQPLG